MLSLRAGEVCHDVEQSPLPCGNAHAYFDGPVAQDIEPVRPRRRFVVPPFNRTLRTTCIDPVFA